MFSEATAGRLLSEEFPDYVGLIRRRRMALVAIPVVLLALLVYLAPRWWAYTIYGILILVLLVLLLLFALTYRAMRVYEGGIAYTSFLIRIYAPWHVLMLHKVNPNSLVLRKVHSIEEAFDYIDANPETYMKFITLNTDMTNFHAIRDYVIDAIYGTPRSQWIGPEFFLQVRE